MIVAALIILIFNTGLIILLSEVVCRVVKAEIKELQEHIDNSIEMATTAIYNMDSIKQKVDMVGRFEL